VFESHWPRGVSMYDFLKGTSVLRSKIKSHKIIVITNNPRDFLTYLNLFGYVQFNFNLEGRHLAHWNAFLYFCTSVSFIFIYLFAIVFAGILKSCSHTQTCLSTSIYRTRPNNSSQEKSIWRKCEKLKTQCGRLTSEFHCYLIFLDPLFICLCSL